MEQTKWRKLRRNGSRYNIKDLADETVGEYTVGYS